MLGANLLTRIPKLQCGDHGMKRLRGLFNPAIIAILTIAGMSIYQQWQSTQAARPDYENAFPPEQRTGIVSGANQIQMPQTERWQLVSVTDGDTIVVRKGWKGSKQEKIRLCGIDAPESKQQLGEESKAYLQQLLTSDVGIVPVERDRYGRLVAEVFVLGNEEKFVQQEMLIAGMAYVYPEYVNGCWNGKQMRMAEEIAQEQKIGVWSGNHQAPWDYRREN